MYRALYREYRPETFSEMLGQQHLVKILRNQIATDSVSHAYLFCGTRGTGKTTTARLLAKGLNCLADDERPCGECENCKSIANGSFIDLIEIDAASNNGVENIRDLRDSVNYPPAVGRKKVYIIDEVHMLSSGAFNALLKTLEEPPANVVFILCTTEPEKLPATILSRCMRMDFRRVSEEELVSAYSRICEEQGVQMDENALRLIVSNADGSVRDGLTILDKCISGRKGVVTRDDVLDSLGAVGEDEYLVLTDCVLDGSIAEGLMAIESMIQSGRDSRQILQGWLAHYRKLLMTKFMENPENILNVSLENVERVRQQSQRIEISDINDGIIEISTGMTAMKTTTQPRIILEMCFVKLASGLQQVANQRELRRKPPTIAKPMAQTQLKPAEHLSDAKIDERISDLMEIWDDVLSVAAEECASLWMAKGGTAPIKMDENVFVISASGLGLDSLKINTALINEKLSERLGKPMSLKIVGDGEEEFMESNKEKDAESLISRLSEQAGDIPIVIE